MSERCCVCPAGQKASACTCSWLVWAPGACRQVFFCKYNDPIYVKLEKLDIMIALASERNIDQARRRSLLGRRACVCVLCMHAEGLLLLLLHMHASVACMPGRSARLHRQHCAHACTQHGCGSALAGCT